MVITVIGKGKDAKDICKELGCKLNDKSADILIRYGYTTGGFKGIEINPIESLHKSMNKFWAIHILDENGVRVPEWHESIGSFYNTGEDKVLVFGRKTHHKKGKDISVYSKFDSTADSKHDYFVRYIPTDREYRVHVFGNKVKDICIKIKKEGDGSQDLIRNLSTGYKQCSCKDWENGYDKLKEICLKTISVLNLDFGAVDVILGKDGRYYVLEVNSAPGLDSKRLKVYSESLKELIENKTKEVENVKMFGKLFPPSWFMELYPDTFDIKWPEFLKNVYIYWRVYGRRVS